MFRMIRTIIFFLCESVCENTTLYTLAHISQTVCSFSTDTPTFIDDYGSYKRQNATEYPSPIDWMHFCWDKFV